MVVKEIKLTACGGMMSRPFYRSVVGTMSQKACLYSHEVWDPVLLVALLPRSSCAGFDRGLEAALGDGTNAPQNGSFFTHLRDRGL